MHLCSPVRVLESSPKGDRIYLVNFQPFCIRGTIYVTSCLQSCISNPSKMGSTIKGKNLGSKFFSFIVDHFSERRQNQFDRSASPETINSLSTDSAVWSKLSILISARRSLFCYDAVHWNSIPRRAAESLFTCRHTALKQRRQGRCFNVVCLLQYPGSDRRWHKSNCTHSQEFRIRWCSLLNLHWQLIYGFLLPSFFGKTMM